MLSLFKRSFQVLLTYFNVERVKDFVANCGQASVDDLATFLFDDTNNLVEHEGSIEATN